MLDKPRELARKLDSRINRKLDAVAALPPPPVFLSVQRAFAVSVPMQSSMLLSFGFHVLLVLGVGAQFFDPSQFMAPHNVLDVVLVNSKSATRPVKADAIAQANLDGGGNTDEARRAKTMLPAIDQSASKNMQQAQERVKQLEQEVKTLMTQGRSTAKVMQGEIAQKESGTPDPVSASDLMQKSIEIQRLEAQIAKEHEAYQQRPKRKFIGARTTESRFATYVDNWRQKIERVGNLNYPEEARRLGIQGQLQLTIAIKSDGEVEDIQINRSSGKKVLDEAAKRIIRLASPFDRFPADIKRDTDVLHITRTWMFGKGDTFTSE